MTAKQASARLGRPFLVLWLSSAISALGDGVRVAALPLIAAIVSSSPMTVALVAFVGQLPWLLTSLIAGALADRLDRRKVMWTVDVARALSMLGLAVLIYIEETPVAILCITAFTLGVGQTLFDTAGQALLPNVVPAAVLASANGRLSTTRMMIASFVGMPLGGFLFATAPGLPFLIDSVSFILAAALVGFALRPASIVSNSRILSESRASMRADISEGVKWLVNHKVLRSVVILVAIVNFTQAATQSILVLYALKELDLNQREYGMLLAASGIGGALGGLLGGILRRWISSGLLFTTTVIVTVPIFLAIGATSNSILAAVMLGLNAFAGITASIMLQTLRQLLVPDRLMARVVSIMGFVSVGIGLPLGSATGGVLAQFLGLRAPFFMSGIVIALACVVVPRISNALMIATSKDTGSTDESDDDIVPNPAK